MPEHYYCGIAAADVRGAIFSFHQQNSITSVGALNFMSYTYRIYSIVNRGL